MACGCGKKTVQRQTAQTTVSRTPAGAGRVATAQTYQSATIKKAPQAAVTRRTV